MGTSGWVQTPALHRGQRDVTDAARPISGRGWGGFWGAHPLDGGQRVVFPWRETIRLGGRAMPGGRKQRRHDKGWLPTREVSPCFAAGG